MNWRSHRDWMAIIREWEKTDMSKDSCDCRNCARRNVFVRNLNINIDCRVPSLEYGICKLR